ncbi:MAG: hypothetical protein WC977_12365 [Anaerovoracaceae bacterium]|jgi:hypothetical protein
MNEPIDLDQLREDNDEDLGVWTLPRTVPTCEHDGTYSDISEE